MGLQRLHDGELGVVLEAGRLVPQDLLQDSQGQRPDRVLREKSRIRMIVTKYPTKDERDCKKRHLHLCLPASPAAAAASS